MTHGGLFRAVAVEAAQRVATFRPQHLANLVWSYGTLGAHDPALFAAVEAEAVARMAAFDAQAVANAAWAFQTCGAATAPLRDAVAARAAALLAELEPQAVGNIVWSLDWRRGAALLDAWYAVHGDDEKPLQSLFTALASAGDDEGRKVAAGLLLGDARDRSAFPLVTRAVERASPDARYRLHRAALAGCRLRNDESRAAQLQKQIHAEGLEALRPAATVRGRMVPFENDRAPSKELDALCELLGDRYEPHLRALPYAFAGDAAAGARSLKYHAEKKALAHLLADDAAELRVDVNFKMCADCHGFFKAASAVVDRPIHVSEGGRPAHTFRHGQCSCGDAWLVCVEIKIIRSGTDRLVDFHTGGDGRSGCGATASPRRRRSPGATARSSTPRGPWPRPGRRASAGTRRPPRSSALPRPRLRGAPRRFSTPSSRWPYQGRTTTNVARARPRWEPAPAAAPRVPRSNQ